jgi:hypothetical protein
MFSALRKTKPAAPASATTDGDELPPKYRRLLDLKAAQVDGAMPTADVTVTRFVAWMRAQKLIDLWLTCPMIEDLYAACCKRWGIRAANAGLMRELLRMQAGVTCIRRRPSTPEFAHLVEGEEALDPKIKAVMWRVASEKAARYDAEAATKPKPTRLQHVPTGVSTVPGYDRAPAGPPVARPENDVPDLFRRAA